MILIVGLMGLSTLEKQIMIESLETQLGWLKTSAQYDPTLKISVIKNMLRELKGELF